MADGQDPLTCARFGLADMLSKLDTTADLAFSVAHSDKSVVCVLYKPGDPDRQEPHDQDELYFVGAGSAKLVVQGGEDIALSAGDAAFIAAHQDHRFESMSADFSCWVVFFGPRQMPETSDRKQGDIL